MFFEWQRFTFYPRCIFRSTDIVAVFVQWPITSWWSYMLKRLCYQTLCQWCNCIKHTNYLTYIIISLHSLGWALLHPTHLPTGLQCPRGAILISRHPYWIWTYKSFVWFHSINSNSCDKLLNVSSYMLVVNIKTIFIVINCHICTFTFYGKHLSPLHQRKTNQKSQVYQSQTGVQSKWCKLKSLSSSAPASQVRCSNRASSDGNIFLAQPGIEPATRP